MGKEKTNETKLLREEYELTQRLRGVRQQLKSIRIKRAHARARSEGRPIGRPVERDDRKVKQLRDTGLSIRAIAKKLGISNWSAQVGVKATTRSNGA